MSIRITQDTMCPTALSVAVFTHPDDGWTLTTTYIPSATGAFPLVTYADETGNRLEVYLSARTVGQWLAAFQTAADMMGKADAIQDLRECAALNREPRGPDAAAADGIEEDLERARDGIEISVPQTSATELEEDLDALLD